MLNNKSLVVIFTMKLKKKKGEKKGGPRLNICIKILNCNFLNEQLRVYFQ